MTIKKYFLCRRMSSIFQLIYLVFIISSAASITYACILTCILNSNFKMLKIITLLFSIENTIEKGKNVLKMFKIGQSLRNKLF